jgi:hypothetical protein
MKQKKVYIIANYSMHPKDPKKTSIPGYMKDPANVRYDEQVIVSVNLKRKDLETSKIILNITDQVIEKNTFNSENSFTELFSYFYKSSPDQISKALRDVGYEIKKVGTENEVNVSAETKESTGSESPTAADIAGA